MNTPEKMRQWERDHCEQGYGEDVDRPGSWAWVVSSTLWGVAAEVCERLDAIIERLPDPRNEPSESGR